jgi:hypothetical protein
VEIIKDVKTILLLTVFLLFVHCSMSNKNNALTKQSPLIEKTDTSKSVILPNGSFYRFVYQSESKYRIEWGNKQFKSISKDTFEYTGNGTLYLLEANNEAIILMQSCGMSCKYSVVLPLSPKLREQTYLFTIALDSKNNVIAYLPEDQQNFIIVKNYLNGKAMEIKENDLCPAASSGECLDTCYFDKSYLIIKWQGSKWKSNKPDPKERKIKLVF